MSSIKIKRINAELVRCISEVLMLETRDPLMKSITITAADVASDLSIAKVYFTSLDDRGHKELEREMEEASDFIRKKIAEMIQIRTIPKLVFKYDESIEYGNKIEKIIKELHEKE